MLRLLHQKLDALADPLDPGFGFDLIRLEAVLADETRPVTISFDANENARAQITFLIDRLAVRFGEQRVQRFVPQDTHIPEAAGVAIPAQERDFDGAWQRKRAADDPPRRPLRLLAKPEEISHVVANTPDGAPARFSWRSARFTVSRAEGPERIAMQWWAHAGLTRDYFRVEASDGQRFWLYRDGLYHQVGAPRWYLQGVFA
jgi:protein ImuB